MKSVKRNYERHFFPQQRFDLSGQITLDFQVRGPGEVVEQLVVALPEPVGGVPLPVAQQGCTHVDVGDAAVTVVHDPDRPLGSGRARPLVRVRAPEVLVVGARVGDVELDGDVELCRRLLD